MELVHVYIVYSFHFSELSRRMRSHVRSTCRKEESSPHRNNQGLLSFSFISGLSFIVGLLGAALLHCPRDEMTNLAAVCRFEHKQIKLELIVHLSDRNQANSCKTIEKAYSPFLMGETLILGPGGAALESRSIAIVAAPQIQLLCVGLVHGTSQANKGFVTF